jgi:two-component system chemotaxis response regulator CheY
VVDELLSRILEPASRVGEAFSIQVDPSPAVPKIEEKPDEPIKCSNCKHESPAKTKFCGNCGNSLEAPKAPPIDSNKILVAEDSIASRRALCFIVKKLGFIPVEATNGYEAVDQAKRDPPGMILMDIMMPAMSGIDALKKIRAMDGLENVPIIMLTSLTDNETVIEAIQNGANDYIVKPYTAEIISERVDKFMPKPKKKKSRRSRK